MHPFMRLHYPELRGSDACHSKTFWVISYRNGQTPLFSFLLSLSQPFSTDMRGQAVVGLLWLLSNVWLGGAMFFRPGWRLRRYSAVTRAFSHTISNHPFWHQLLAQDGWGIFECKWSPWSSIRSLPFWSAYQPLWPKHSYLQTEILGQLGLVSRGWTCYS